MNLNRKDIGQSKQDSIKVFKHRSQGPTELQHKPIDDNMIVDLDSVELDLRAMREFNSGYQA